MKNQLIGIPAAVVLALVAAPSARAIDVTAGAWTLSFDGNVNANYIYSTCQDHNDVAGGLACVSDTTSDSSSAVSNGLLPAALTVSGATTQDGQNLGFTFGLYPGISTNDGGSPNLQAIANNDLGHTALGTAGLDVRQVFLTVGNSSWGTIMAGRNIGFFGADAILNDMTLLGVGAGNGDYAAPANTSLGIDRARLHLHRLALADQLHHARHGRREGHVRHLRPAQHAGPDAASTTAPRASRARSPTRWAAVPVGQRALRAAAVLCTDLAAAAASLPRRVVLRWLRQHGLRSRRQVRLRRIRSHGMVLQRKGRRHDGTVPSNYNDAMGKARDSNGFLAQVTYKMGNTKVGVNYGESNLDGTGLDISACTAPAASCCLVRNTSGRWATATTSRPICCSSPSSAGRLGQYFNTSTNSWNLNAGLFLKF